LAHVDLQRSRVSVRGKGQDDYRWISIPENTADSIRRWLRHRGDESGPLFCNLDSAHNKGRLSTTAIYYLVQRIGAAIGVDTHPHALRHQAITDLLDLTNGDVRSVQQFSRHKSVDTLLLYDDNRRNVASRMASLLAKGI